MRTLFTFLLLPFCLFATGQDTSYINKKLLPCNKDQATYYRIIWPKSDGRYKVEDHFLSGKLHISGSYLTNDPVGKNKKDGYFTYFDSTGVKNSEGAFQNGTRVGVWKSYYKDGSIMSQSTYRDSTLAEARSFFKNGQLERVDVHHKDAPTEGHTYDSTGKELPYVAPKLQYVEQMPEAPFDIGRYLSENIVYPESARKNGIEGRVIVKFVVNENGSLSDLTVVRGIGGGCDEEALRVLSGMPPWKPGKQNGAAVKVFFTLPIVFKLTNRN